MMIAAPIMSTKCLKLQMIEKNILANKSYAKERLNQAGSLRELTNILRMQLS